MNVINTEAPVGETAITDVKHYVIDDEGNRIEVAAPDSDGEASREETAFIAERSPDHVIDTADTIH